MNPSISKHEHYIWLDIAKTIGIFLVVFGHLPNSKFVSNFLWTFHVPLFFFLAGYLSSFKDTPSFVLRLGYRLAVPYIFSYLLLTALSTYLSQSFDFGNILATIIGVFYGTHSYEHFVAAPLWFLPSLMSVEVLYFFLVRRHWAFYVTCLALSLWLFHHGRLNLFFSFDLSLLGLNYFVVGIVVRSGNVLNIVSKNKKVLAAAFGIGLAVVADFSLNGNVWYAGNSYVQSFIGGISGIAMLISIALLIQDIRVFQNRLVAFISNNTLFILCFHGISNSIALSALSRLNISSGILNSLLTATLSILLLLPINLAFIRLAPWAIGVADRRRENSLSHTTVTAMALVKPVGENNIKTQPAPPPLR